MNKIDLFNLTILFESYGSDLTNSSSRTRLIQFCATQTTSAKSNKIPNIRKIMKITFGSDKLALTFI